LTTFDNVRVPVISVNKKLIDGPWGGGNRFLKQLKDSGLCTVIHELDAAADLLLILDARESDQNTFSVREALPYGLKYDIPLVVRINETYERNQIIYGVLSFVFAGLASDVAVYVSEWQASRWYFRLVRGRIIPNGTSSPLVVNLPRCPGRPISMVTHHWGNHYNKGWDIYKYIDEYLVPTGAVIFTFIGNVNPDFSLENSVVKGPLSGDDLIVELKSHDIYITGSRFEPGPNHVIEALECGLPILYRKDPTLDEYLGKTKLAYSFLSSDELPILVEKINSIFQWRKSVQFFGLVDISEYLTLGKEGSRACRVKKFIGLYFLETLYLVRQIYLGIKRQRF